MDTEKEKIIGLISAGIVTLSIIPYAIRTYRREITPVILSWSLWSLIAFALLVTYKSSGAKENIWPMVASFVNPVLVTTIALLRKNTTSEKMGSLDWGCLVLGLVSLALWVGVYDQKELAQYALYLAIFADVCAAIATWRWVRKHPEKDRPFAWFLFAVGYSLAFFAITEHTLANYALPIYMVGVALIITFPLAHSRWKRRAPFWDWI